MIAQRCDIVAPLAQRRDMNRYDVQPVIEILAKALLGDLGGQVARRARDDADIDADHGAAADARSEEHTTELQSLMRISYAVFCLKQKRHMLYTNENRHRLRDSVLFL